MSTLISTLNAQTKSTPKSSDQNSILQQSAKDMIKKATPTISNLISGSEPANTSQGAIKIQEAEIESLASKETVISQAGMKLAQDDPKKAAEGTMKLSDFGSSRSTETPTSPLNQRAISAYNQTKNASLISRGGG